MIIAGDNFDAPMRWLALMGCSMFQLSYHLQHLKPSSPRAHLRQDALDAIERDGVSIVLEDLQAERFADRLETVRQIRKQTNG